MNIVNNGYIVDNLTNSVLCEARKEVYNNPLSFFDIEELRQIFNSQIVIPVFRLYMLDESENVVRDISMDFISGDLSCTYQSGKRRTLNASLINYNKKYTPSIKNTSIYLGAKFRLDTGVLINGTIYWFQQGVFLLQDPSQTSNDSNQVIQFNLHDKFSLYDGTISGTTYLKTIVPQGVPMKQAFTTIITSECGAGKPFDIKPLIFNSKYQNELTPKTIRQETGTNLGEILVDYAGTICSDVYYNTQGNMVVEDNVNTFLNANFPIAWRVCDGDRILYDKSMTYNWSKLRNKIIVKGAIVNGYQFTGQGSNINPMSVFNINGKYGLRAEVINDGNLYSDNLCEEKALYTLVERQRGVKSLSLTMGYMPFIDVNQSFLVSLDDFDLSNANFVVDSFNLSCSSNPTMSVNLTNIGEVVFR